MLTELNLQKFNSFMDKCKRDFQRQIHACYNGVVQHFVYLHLMLLCISASDVNDFIYFFLLFVLWAHCLNYIDDDRPTDKLMDTGPLLCHCV